MNHKRKIVSIIQARMGSSRLPGKVLKEVAGKPLLAHLINRIQPSNLVEEIIIATTTDSPDDDIQQFCIDSGVNCFRGHPFDVLDRYYQAACEYQADVVVRLTGDCPIVDGELIDTIVSPFLDLNVDFAANRLPPPWKRTYPIGLDIEVVSFPALERAWKEAKLPFEREHVLPFLYDQPERFKTLLVHHDPDFGDKRWTVDTPEDLILVQNIFDHFMPRFNFSWREVLNWLATNPDLEAINKGISHKSVDDVDQRFKIEEK